MTPDRPKDRAASACLTRPTPSDAAGHAPDCHGGAATDGASGDEVLLGRRRKHQWR
jgi:hypothetical protein